MRHKTIEETFRAIKPKQHGVPVAAPIGAGFTSTGGGFSDSLSQAAQEIAQLRSSYQAQADLIAANTSALEKNASGSGSQLGGSSIANTAKNFAENTLGGGLLGIIPLISGIARLFGGGSSAPPPLPTYTAPPSIELDSTIRNGSGFNSDPQALTSMLAGQWNGRPSAGTTPSNNDQPSNAGMAGKAAFSPQVTVNISAMDSQSFMDRSADIASAVREAVLNLHPLNSVLAEL